MALKLKTFPPQLQSDGPRKAPEKVLSDGAKPKECKGWISALKRRSPRLIYKAGDKATGIKKNKQPAEGSGNNRRQEEKSADEPQNRHGTDDMDVTVTERGALGRLWKKCNNAVKSEKVDYIWIRMLGVDFLFPQEESGPRHQQRSDVGRGGSLTAQQHWDTSP